MTDYKSATTNSDQAQNSESISGLSFQIPEDPKPGDFIAYSLDVGGGAASFTNDPKNSNSIAVKLSFELDGANFETINLPYYGKKDMDNWAFLGFKDKQYAIGNSYEIDTKQMPLLLITR